MVIMKQQRSLAKFLPACVSCRLSLSTALLESVCPLNFELPSPHNFAPSLLSLFPLNLARLHSHALAFSFLPLLCLYSVIQSLRGKLTEIEQKVKGQEYAGKKHETSR